MLGLIRRNPDLKPYREAIEKRMTLFEQRKHQILPNGGSLNDFANAHHYFGIHHTAEGWVYREWAPAAEQLYLTGEFNGWNQTSHPLTRLEHGNWEIQLPEETLKPGMLVKTIVKSNGQLSEHIPLYATRVTQDPTTVVWSCEVVDDRNTYPWTDEGFASSAPILIYESHVGMCSEEGKVSTYRDFADNVLPRIKWEGYNTVQLMAIMEHPYYASFGYQVSNFFAASSRFGTPDDLKYLIDRAHSLGIRVLLDLVHAHAVKNTKEGINCFDGTTEQFFHAGGRGEHPDWGTKVFDYAKPEVLHFLLSNLKFWMEEYHFDGFRFDGVSSMLYINHRDEGSGNDKYFSDNTDYDSITYLQLANELIHEINPHAVTIAEDVSCMAGITAQIKDGGIGFDYRLAMGEPDMWLKLVRDVRDEDWNMDHIYYEMTSRREKTIAYVECHDQALVGDKTLFFRMCDVDIYDKMDVNSHSLRVERAMALTMMSRLLTMSSGGDGYLNFMGNEFGHPEWIDFPREGNGWSHDHARRQWSLMYREDLRFRFLAAFDRDMLAAALEGNIFKTSYPTLDKVHNDDHVLAYERNGLLFVYNFDPVRSYDGYRIPVTRDTDYQVILCTDDYCYGGQGRVDRTPHSACIPGETGNTLRLYLPSRVAMVLKPLRKKPVRKPKAEAVKA